MSVNDVRDVAQSRLTFKRDSTFHKELRRRVDDYFRSSKRSQRDCPAMYLKSAIILAGFGGFYSLLVFVAGSWWQAFPLAALLGLSMAAIGFNIEHDGSHHSHSNQPGAVPSRAAVTRTRLINPVVETHIAYPQTAARVENSNRYRETPD